MKLAMTVSDATLMVLSITTVFFVSFMQSTISRSSTKTLTPRQFIHYKSMAFKVQITLLTKKGWDKPLSAYFEKQYNFPSDGIIILDELKDFSIGSGVYSATFQLRTPRREKITVFLK